MALKSHCELCGKTVLGVFSSLKKVDGNYLCPECARIRRKGGQKPQHAVESGVHLCPYCAEEIQPTAMKCKHCGEYLTAELRMIHTKEGPAKSNGVAGFLAFLLGPVGLWYKGNWAAGFAWLIMAIIFLASTGAFALPFLWIGMIIHAVVAKPK